MSGAAPLKLLAQDADDLKVLAAAAQDAIGKIGDISYDGRKRTLTVLVNRYRWEIAGGERVRAAIQLGSVLGVEARRLRRNAKDAVVELLSIEFEPGDAPGGAVTFTFAGGGDLRAKVECLDVVLADLGSPWPTSRRPRHEI